MMYPCSHQNLPKDVFPQSRQVSNSTGQVADPADVQPVNISAYALFFIAKLDQSNIVKKK